MPTTPEQSNNHEQELDLSENTTLEFQTPEQKLEQQGQQLAAQIKDMHANAQTKEDYEAVQKKIAELREMFEVENKELPSAYRNFVSLMEAAESCVAVGQPKRMSDWKWVLHQPGLESGHDTTKLTVNMGTKLDLSLYKDADEYDFSKLPPIMSLKVLRSGFGCIDLGQAIEHSDVKSYVNESGTWVLEVEPQPFDDFLTVYNHIFKKIDEEKFPGMVFVAKPKRSNNIFINTHYNFSELDEVSDMDFCSFPPKELVSDKDWALITYNQSYKGHWISLDQLTEMFAGKQARSYNTDGRWIMEVLDEPEKEAEPAKEKEPQDLEALVMDIMGKVDFGGPPESFHWKVSSDTKYIITDLFLPSNFLDNTELFQSMGGEESQKFRQTDFSKYNGIGLNDLILTLRGQNKMAISMKNGDRWIIKLVD